MSTFIEVHALHTLPPSNINRDDTGSPKTATFGGVPRQRVSSQAWKHAIRMDFESYLDRSKLGVRTKRAVDVIARQVVEKNPEWLIEDARSAVAEVFTKGGFKLTTPKPKKDQTDVEASPETSYLFFISRRQIENVADFVLQNEEGKVAKKDAQKLLDTEHSVDLAMFGRMVADAPDFNVDASVQVAHAIGVSAATPEFDYFTAVDDVAKESEETGAGMIGTVEMMASTLYRYATVDLEHLAENLGTKAAAVEATVAFVRSFIASMPTGKQNTFANRTLPDLVVVAVRKDRPVSWVNAFEEPVTASGHGVRAEAAKKLVEEASSLEEMYDSPALETLVIAPHSLVDEATALGSVVTRKELLEQLESTLAEQLSEFRDMGEN